MSRRTLRRFTCLLLAVPCLALSGCDTSADNCEDSNSNYEETFFLANLRGADNKPPPSGTACQELCRLVGYQGVECRLNDVGATNESVTCITGFVCEE
jgi:hypothetical protein